MHTQVAARSLFSSASLQAHDAAMSRLAARVRRFMRVHAHANGGGKDGLEESEADDCQGSGDTRGEEAAAQWPWVEPQDEDVSPSFPCVPLVFDGKALHRFDECEALAM